MRSLGCAFFAWSSQWLAGEGFNSLPVSWLSPPGAGGGINGTSLPQVLGEPASTGADGGINVTFLPQVLGEPASAGLAAEGHLCTSRPYLADDATELRRITLRNCRAVDRASRLDLGQADTRDWMSRIQSAQASCEEAEVSLAGGNFTKAADLALNAWGSVLMKDRECCNMVEPPFCQSPGKKKLVHALPLFFVLLVMIANFLTNKCCRRFVRYPDMFFVREPRKLRDDEVKVSLPSDEPRDGPPSHDSSGSGEVQADRAVGGGSEARLDSARLDAAMRTTGEVLLAAVESGDLGRSLRAIAASTATASAEAGGDWLWDNMKDDSSMKVLLDGSSMRPDSAVRVQELKDTMLKIFKELHEAFGFQKDNVQNQFEHFLSLWRGQYSMVYDEQSYAGANEEVLARSLEQLHRNMLAGFAQWKGRAWRIAHVYPCVSHDSRTHVRQLLELACYLLIWGEAGNLRFMPEALYFILDLALGSFGGTSDGTPRVERFRFQPRSLEEKRFLVYVVRPIYNALFDENYDYVKGKGKKVLREGYDAFMPADCANYDDWTELFNDPERLVEELELVDGGGEFYRNGGGASPTPGGSWSSSISGGSAAHVPVYTSQFEDLPNVNWPKVLRGNKTHREVHSLWGLYAATHRIWFLHALIFLLTFCVAQDHQGLVRPASGLRVQLAGGTLLERFATAGLLVPLHGFLWSVSRFISRGTDIHRRRWGGYYSCKCCAAVLRMLSTAAFWGVPLLTYAWVRYCEVTGDASSGAALLLHFLVCFAGALVILVVPVGTTAFDSYPCLSFFASPERSVMIWNTTPVECDHKLARWLFWVLVFAVKTGLGYAGVVVMVQTLDSLGVAFVDNEAIEDVVLFSFHTAWDRDVIWYAVFFITSLVMYCTDTLFWGMIMGCAYGPLIALYQRGGANIAKAWANLVCGDNVHGIAEQFQNKVLHYLTEEANPEGEGWNKANAFAVIWNRVIDVMYYETKLSEAEKHNFRYRQEPAPNNVEAHWELNVDRDALRQARDGMDPHLASGPLSFQPCLQRYLTRELPIQCFVTEDWPKVPEVQWRFEAMSRGLSLEMPRPYRAPYIPNWTTMIPHYGEDIIRSKASLFKEGVTDIVPMMGWLHDMYKAEFQVLKERKQGEFPADPVAWRSYGEAGWGTLRNWSSMHTQTLFRTVAGVSLYRLGLMLLAQVQGKRETEIDRKLMAFYQDNSNIRDVFTCMVAMQRYADFRRDEYESTEQLFEKYGASMCVAFIDSKVLEPEDHDAADSANIHPDQEARFFSCRVTRACEVGSSLKRKPDFSVELPGFPILGNGKGDNQNSAIIFSRGLYIQGMDMNQGGYLEQMLMMPCALGEFRDNNQKIVGFPEHITSDLGSVGEFAASAETVFGTMMQRVYAFMGARMHYGHPDIMSKVWVMQQGGVSKATQTVNLSEDIFAGMDFTLRGRELRGQTALAEHTGRTIKHAEYLYLGKGRDLGFSLVLTFFMKLAAGTGEQVLTRQMYRLGHIMDLPEFLTFYYAHAGFYLGQYLISRSVPLLMFLWLLVILGSGDAELITGAAASKPRTDIMAEYFASSYSWILALFMAASMLPVLVEGGITDGLAKATLKAFIQLVTLAPLHFIFQAKVIGIYIMNEIQYGGATYMATGRDLPTVREPFVKLYKMFAAQSFYDGTRLLAGALIAWAAGGLQSSGGEAPELSWWKVSLALPIASWLLAPFIFNPYQFNWRKFYEDFTGSDGPQEFFLGEAGRKWVLWYENEQLKPSKGLRRSSIVFLIQVIPIFCWYSAVNSKLHMLEVAYSNQSEVYTMVVFALVPSAFVSFIVAFGISCCHRSPEEFPQGTGSDEDWQPHLGDDPAAIRAAMKARDVAARTWQNEEERNRPPTTPSALMLCTLLLPIIDVVVACCCMSKFFALCWWKTIAAGFMLQYWWLTFMLFLCECLLRIPAVRPSPPADLGPQRGRRARQRAAAAPEDQVKEAAAGLASLINNLRVPDGPDQQAADQRRTREFLVKHRDFLEARRYPRQWLGKGMLEGLRLWLYSHRLAMDLIVAATISLMLLPGLLLDKANHALLPQFNLHTLLVYRSPTVPGEVNAGVRA